MEKAAAPGSLEFENEMKGEPTVTLDNRTPTEIYSGIDFLPGNLCRIVADYISDEKGDPINLLLLGKQPITVCFSQRADVEPGSCWQFGCLSHEDRLVAPIEASVDKKYHIKDYQSCIDFLDRQNSAYFPTVIEDLVLQIDLFSKDFSSVCDDFQFILVQLKEHLNAVLHVVFEIENGAFCCFSFKDVIDNVTGLTQTVDRQAAFTQIFVDLLACWSVDQTLSTKLLLDHYVLQDVKPDSDMYLSKFVISPSHIHDQDFFDVVTFNVKSNKLKRLYYVDTLEEMNQVDQRIIQNCHAIMLDAFNFKEKPSPLSSSEPTFSLEDNLAIERIVINSRLYGCKIKLPQPRAPLMDPTPRSALIEITLMGNNNTFDLSQLNNNFFPHLEHLCIIGGKMTGFLDSQNVPSLKTLKIELGLQILKSRSNANSLVSTHTQAIIDAGRPWQLVASQDQQGWSLASYDKPIANPQDEVKEDSLPSLPFIKELLLVMETPRHTGECLSRLNGTSSRKAAANRQNDGLLVWSPENVEKITAFSPVGKNAILEFKKEIPGKPRILRSLTCYNIAAVLHGAALPHLQWLDVNGAWIQLSGAFLELRRLSFYKCELRSPWEMNAPRLESFNCQSLQGGNKLSLRPALLPRLSYLQIELYFELHTHCPKIIVDENSSGLSRIKHVVFNKAMTKYPLFNEYQVHHVSHLELTVDALHLPTCWEEKWQCETLTLHVHVSVQETLLLRKINFIRLPELLTRVKKLTVTTDECPAMLDSEMPELTDLTVPSPSMLGENVNCPKLRCIRFTEKLSERDKEKCLDRATYETIGARPELVYFGDNSYAKKMSWAVAPSATGVSSAA